MKVNLLNANKHPSFITQCFYLTVAHIPHVDVVGVQFSSDEFKTHDFADYPYIPFQLVSNSNQLRQAEFFAGRYSANLALQRNLQTSESFCLMKGRGGQPIWPKSVYGSITHSRSLALAVVTDQDIGLGIDCEPVMDLPTAKQVQHIVCQQQELAMMNNLGFGYEFMVTLLFSAKESIYKGIYSYIEGILDFDCVVLNDICYENQQLVFSSVKDISKSYRRGKCFLINYYVFKNEIITMLVDG